MTVYTNQEIRFSLLALITLLMLVVSGCDSKDAATKSASNSVQPAVSSSASDVPPPQVMPGYTYKYINDGTCKAGDNEICMSPEEYESFCKYSKGMAKSVTNRLAMGNEIAFKLYEGGFVESTNISWNPVGTIYKCRAKLVVQGNYQGSSRREIVDGAAMFFKNTNDGDLIVTYADPNSP